MLLVPEVFDGAVAIGWRSGAYEGTSGTTKAKTDETTGGIGLDRPADLPGSTRIYPELPGSTRIYPDLPRSTRIYPDIPTWDLMAVPEAADVTQQ